MTNLIEKSLIIGFGILLLLIFFPLVNPFLSLLSEFNDDYNNEMTHLEEFITQIDKGINMVIDNSELNYIQQVEYPPNLNVTFNNQYAKFDFLIKGQMQYKILFYNHSFIYRFFHEICPQIYLLNVSWKLNLINVQII